jgi:hypothetical protein
VAAVPGDVSPTPLKKKKWNINDAMRSVTLAWKAISNTIIYTCFTTWGFGTKKFVNTKNQDNIEKM